MGGAVKPPWGIGAKQQKSKDYREQIDPLSVLTWLLFAHDFYFFQRFLKIYNFWKFLEILYFWGFWGIWAVLAIKIEFSSRFRGRETNFHQKRTDFRKNILKKSRFFQQGEKKLSLGFSKKLSKFTLNNIFHIHFYMEISILTAKTPENQKKTKK